MPSIKPIYQESLKQVKLHKAFLGWLPRSIQDRIGMLRCYKINGSKGNGNPIIAMIDGTTFHGGLTDRWKGIISLYAFAKATKRDFKIHYVYPFAIEKFQIPFKHNWIISVNDISQNLFTSHMLRIVGDPSINRLHNLPANKQIHVYANRDYVEIINKIYGSQFSWGALFKELFQPSALLQKELDSFSKYTHKPYIAIALRMQNLLGDYPEYAYKPANKHRQQEIIAKCVDFIKQIHEQWDTHILVTSDSNLMTDVASQLPYVWTNRGKAAHVDTISSAPTDYYLKSFVDFYLLSNAQKIYSATTKEMYVSDFPLYAAKINGTPFERVILD